MKTCFWRDAIEGWRHLRGKAGIHNVVATGLWPVELVGRAVLCSPREIHVIGALGSDAPYHDGPQGRGYNAINRDFALRVARRNQAAN